MEFYTLNAFFRALHGTFTAFICRGITVVLPWYPSTAVYRGPESPYGVPFGFPYDLHETVPYLVRSRFCRWIIVKPLLCRFLTMKKSAGKARLHTAQQRIFSGQQRSATGL